MSSPTTARPRQRPAIRESTPSSWRSPPRRDDLRQHRPDLHARRTCKGGRLGPDGNFLRHRPDRCLADDHQLSVRRYAQLHPHRRHHHRQQLRWRADLDRQRYAGPIHGGLAVGHVLHHQPEHYRPDRGRRRSRHQRYRQCAQQYGSRHRRRGDRAPRRDDFEFSDAALVQWHKRRKSQCRFDADWINPLRNDLLRRGK